MITKDDIKKIANLARLELTEQEIEKFAKELDEILIFFDKLKEVDTEGVEAVSQITGLHNRLRLDEIEPSTFNKELLACSPNEVANNQVVVKNVF